MPRADNRELVIYPEKNKHGNYEVGRYYWAGQEADGEIWRCEFETSSYSNAVLLTYINRLYQMTDYILHPDDYNLKEGELSLSLLIKYARKFRQDLDKQLGELTLELIEECFKRAPMDFEDNDDENF